ncbi:hypothetical protein BLOT_003611 [Blomia tropicalis]|nr:hypothetical protein BLOT_003611 [Blomia tropicalis]
MVSLRIPFYNIVPLIHQYGLKGSVVNVSIDEIITFLSIYDLDFVKVFYFKLNLFHGGYRDFMVVHQHEPLCTSKKGVH